MTNLTSIGKIKINIEDRNQANQATLKIPITLLTSAHQIRNKDFHQFLCHSFDKMQIQQQTFSKMYKGNLNYLNN